MFTYQSDKIHPADAMFIQRTFIVLIHAFAPSYIMKKHKKYDINNKCMRDQCSLCRTNRWIGGVGIKPEWLSIKLFLQWSHANQFGNWDVEKSQKKEWKLSTEAIERSMFSLVLTRASLLQSQAYTVIFLLPLNRIKDETETAVKIG